MFPENSKFTMERVEESIGEKGEIKRTAKKHFFLCFDNISRSLYSRDENT